MSTESAGSTDSAGNSEGTRPDAAMSTLVLESFMRVVGGGPRPPPPRPRPADARRGPGGLYEDAPCCVLAHDTAADPRFTYANKAAQRCFEYPWAEFAGLPSRLSAEAPDRVERQALLDKVARDGFAEGYKGLRVSRSGRRFLIEDVTVWQLLDARGVLHGQGALFPAWRDAPAEPDGRSGARHAG